MRYTIYSPGAAKLLWGAHVKRGHYFAPTDYEGDVPFSKPYGSASAAKAAARIDRELASHGGEALRLG